MKYTKIILVPIIITVSIFLSGKLIFASNSEAINLRKGLVAHWTFNEKKGDVVFDQTNNQNDGNFKCVKEDCSLPQRVPGIIGEAIKFDGKDDLIFVQDPSNNELDIAGDLTLSLWFKLSPDAFSSPGTLIAKRYVSNEFYLWVLPRKDIKFNHGRDEEYEGIGFDLPEINVNKWYHVVLIRNSSDSCARLCLNGNCGECNSYSLTPKASDYPVTLGARYSNGGYLLSGIMDEIRIYDRALTKTEAVGIFTRES